MKATKKEAEVLNNAIEEWTSSGKLSPEQSAELKDSIEVNSDAQPIAHYFFFVALSCALLAFGAIFIDDKLLEKVKSYFLLSDLVVAIAFTALSFISFIWLKKKRQHYSPAVFEVYSVISSLLVSIALVYYCKDTGFGPNYSGFLIVASCLLTFLSLWLPSRSLWIINILALMGWYGAFSNWLSTDNLFLGMNYPMRFSVFGILIVALSMIQSRTAKLRDTERITYLAGLAILLTGLWGVSVFGNYNSLEEWAKVRQVQVIAYSIVFAGVAGLLFYFGYKRGDTTTRDIGLFALLINLYTRYFEFFWDSTNKGIFFLLLALSFWFIGKRIDNNRKRKMQQQA